MGKPNSNKSAQAGKFTKKKPYAASRNTKDASTCPKPESTCYHNDPVWYMQNPQLAQDSAKINFTTRVGQVLELNRNSDWYASTSVPGIIACHFVPGVGYATGPDSPINIAGKQLATYVRSRASNSLQDYDYLDMIMYCMAYDSLQMYIEWCRRIYGLVAHYDPLNLYEPQAWAAINGVDLDDLALNAPNFRTAINRMINSLSRFTVPRRFPLFDRHKVLCSSVYRDSQEAYKSQYYIWIPDYLWMMGLDEDGAGCLKPIQMPWIEDLNYRASLEAIVNFGNTLIDALYEYSYGHVIASDLQRAFGPADMYTIPYVEENYETPKVYDEFMLDQIENATFVGTMGCAGSDLQKMPEYWIKQDETKGFITHAPKFYYTNQPITVGVDVAPGRSWLEGKRLVNFTTPNVSAGSQIEATLFTNIPDPESFTWTEDGNVGYLYPTMTTEVATTFDVVFMGNETNSSGGKYPGLGLIQGYTTALVYGATPTDDDGDNIASDEFISIMNRIIRSMTMLSAFRRHPQVVLCGCTTAFHSGMEPKFAPSIGPILQTEVFGVVNRDVLEAMAKVATDCMFDVANPISIDRHN